MSAEPTKVENQPSGEAPAVAPAETTAQPAENNAAEANPAAVENAAADSATATAPDTKPAADTTTSATGAEETGSKEEQKEESKPEESKPEDTKPEDTKDAKPKEEAPKETPLIKLANRLPTIIENAGHDEMWGVTLSGLDHAPTTIVLQKYLRANDDDIALAEKQLTSALKWRKEVNPAALLDEKVYDRTKFGDLGFVTEHKDDQGKEAVITWNVYGAVKDNKATFGDIKEFLDWRVALMEFGTRKLNINAATAPIPDGSEDPYRMIQVHDYLSVAFLRMDPHIKAASTKTIETLSMAYPELLAHKYFVNVPTIMSWAFKAMKLFLSPATLRKFHPLSSGTSLVTEMPAYASSLPKEYGGSGPSVKEGLTVKLTDVPAADEGENADKSAAATSGGAKKDEAPKDETKEEDKPAEAKDEAKPEGAEVEETKPQEAKPQEAKPEEVKAEEAVKDEPAAKSNDAAEPKTQ